MASALQHCHTRDRDRNFFGVIHGDIWPPNIFLAEVDGCSEYPRVVLGDFGCAEEVEAYGVDGTAAPQELKGEFNFDFKSPKAPDNISPKSNIFQLGLVMKCLIHRVESIMEDLDDKGSDRYSPALKSLSSMCLRFQPERRPSAEELVAQIRAQRKKLRVPFEKLF